MAYKKQRLLKLFFIFILIGVIGACKENPTQKIIRKNVGKKVSMEGLDSVRFLNSILSYNEFRKKYQYVCIIYIDQDCSVCKTKVLEWKMKRDLLKKLPDNIAYLFLYRGDRPERYFSELSEAYELTKDDLDFHFFFIQDVDFKFVSRNQEIPQMIIDASILIDKNDRIAVIGSPFLNASMMKLYEKVLSN